MIAFTNLSRKNGALIELTWVETKYIMRHPIISSQSDERYITKNCHTKGSKYGFKVQIQAQYNSEMNSSNFIPTNCVDLIIKMTLKGFQQRLAKVSKPNGNSQMFNTLFLNNQTCNRVSMRWEYCQANIIVEKITNGLQNLSLLLESCLEIQRIKERGLCRATP